jgi:hypothetical protein
MIATEVSSIAYTGNNSTTTSYAIPFPFLDDSHIAVTFTNAAGTIASLTYLTDYTVGHSTDTDGRITSGTLLTVIAYDNTNTVSLKRSTPALQSTDFVAGGTIDPESLESAFDRVTMTAQEAVRDVTNDGTSTITATALGIPAQTVAGTFVGRTITPAANSGLSLTNGDGIAGNPTIDLDETGLTVITAVADGDLVRVETSSGSEVITVANLLARNAAHYQYREIETDRFAVEGGATGVSIADGFLKFTGTAATAGVSAPLVVPNDYLSGVISVKLHAYLNGASASSPFVMNVSIWDDNGPAIGSIVGTVQAQTILTSATDCRSAIFDLGSSLVAGNHYVLSIERDSADAADTSSEEAFIKSVRMEYSATRVTTSWA